MDPQPIQPTPLPVQIPQKRGYKKVLLFILVSFITGFIAYGFATGQITYGPPKRIPPVPKPSPPDVTTDWEIYYSQDHTLRFKVPAYLSVTEKDQIISISTAGNDPDSLVISHAMLRENSRINVNSPPAEIINQIGYDNKGTVRFLDIYLPKNYVVLNTLLSGVSYGGPLGNISTNGKMQFNIEQKWGQKSKNGIAKETDEIFDKILNTFSTNNFSKRLYNTQKFLYNIDFPVQLSSIPDDQLQSIYCVEYNANDQGQFFAYENASTNPVRVNLNDYHLLTIINDKPSIASISKCVSETGKTIISYVTDKRVPEGGGLVTFGESSIGVLESDNTLRNVKSGEIVNQICTQPYAWSLDDRYFVHCGGIYQIDLTTTTSTKLLECTSNTDKLGGINNNAITCQPGDFTIADSDNPELVNFESDKYKYSLQFPLRFEHRYEFNSHYFLSPDLETNAVPVVTKGGQIFIEDPTLSRQLTFEEHCAGDVINNVDKCVETLVEGKKVFIAVLSGVNVSVARVFENENSGAILTIRAEYTDDSKEEILGVFNQIISSLKFVK